MKIFESIIPGLKIIEPTIYSDKRGYFYESFNYKELSAINELKFNFVQDNESKSHKGVLRGLHFQIPPFSQTKLVRCIFGVVIDVAVDIRKGSPTFGKHFSIKLSGENKKQLLIPKGFAHGFCVLSDYAIFAYKVDNYYSPNHEFGIRWDDCNLNIDWGYDEKKIQLSKKDIELPLLREIDSPFKFSQ